MARNKKTPQARRGKAASTSELPDKIPPMMARLAEGPFDSDAHAFEIKWDGTRCIAFVERDGVRLQNRRHAKLTDRYPELRGLCNIPAGTVVDGEIIVLEGGKPSFPKLQSREHLSDPTRIEMASKRTPATFMVFDLLYLRGRSVMTEPLESRRKHLIKTIKALGDPHIVVPDQIVGAGCRYFEAAREHALEGIMAKKLGSPYLPGKRSDAWQKIKVARIEAFDLLGFVQRPGEAAIKALIVGERSGDRWLYRANVGSGFTEPLRASLFARLDKLPRLPDPPSDGPKDGTWRATGLKCRVRFFERTASGRLRGPVYEGIVED